MAEIVAPRVGRTLTEAPPSGGNWLTSVQFLGLKGWQILVIGGALLLLAYEALHNSSSATSSSTDTSSGLSPLFGAVDALQSTLGGGGSGNGGGPGGGSVSSGGGGSDSNPYGGSGGKPSTQVTYPSYTVRTATQPSGSGGPSSGSPWQRLVAAIGGQPSNAITGAQVLRLSKSPIMNEGMGNPETSATDKAQGATGPHGTAPHTINRRVVAPPRSHPTYAPTQRADTAPHTVNPRIIAPPPTPQPTFGGAGKIAQLGHLR